MPWWWISFADEEKDEFLGVVITEAADFEVALMKTEVMGINPGGQAAGLEIPEYDDRDFVDRLLTEEECRAHFEAKSVAEFKDEWLKVVT